MPRQPLAHLWMLVGRIVVDDGVDHLSHGDPRLDRIEEADELLVAMALHVAANDGPIEDVELARHLSKYVPGNPAIVASNMPGAASNAAAAHIYQHRAKRRHRDRRA